MTDSVTTLRAERVAAADGIVAAVGECPVWRGQEGVLYWVDIPNRKLFRLHLDRGALTTWLMPERIGCFTFDRNGQLLVALERGLYAADLAAAPAGGALEARLLAAPDFAMGNMRFNDGRCDRQGRFWSGTMVQDTAAGHAAGALYRFDAVRGLSRPQVDQLIVQNGLAWSPDGRTMYLSDSHASRRLVWAFDYDIDAGVPGARRVFADLHDYVGRPDGAAVDAEGGYWICANDGGRVLRFTPDGRLERQVMLPVSKPGMCAFGGPDLDILFITTIPPALDAGPDDGKLFSVRPGVRGLPEPGFAGQLADLRG